MASGGSAAAMAFPRFLFAAVLTAVLPTAARAAEGPRVVDAYVRPPLVPGRPAAGYFTLTGGARADVLTGVSSPDAARVEMHATVRQGGASVMVDEARVAVPARGWIVYAPGGRHLMIFGLKPGGRPVTLRLRFQSGAVAVVRAPRRAARDEMAGMAGMAHH